MNRTSQPSIKKLPAAWRRQAKTLRRYGGNALATAIERCADELEGTIQERDETTLTLTDAARESGYTREHLGRLVRDGKIPNAGRPNAPRIARRHLPIKRQDPESPFGSRLARERDRRQVSGRGIVRSIIATGITDPLSCCERFTYGILRLDSRCSVPAGWIGRRPFRGRLSRAVLSCTSSVC